MRDSDLMIDSDEELRGLSDPNDPIFDPLPLPGAGQTADRFRALWSFARRSPSLGRVAEAHHDASAILSEAGRTELDPGPHAVWAARGPDPLRLERRGSRWHLGGSKHWCSASTFASRALVTADCANVSGALVLVDLADPGVRIGPRHWESPAMTAVETRTVHFDLDIDADDIVGVDDWYLQRPGFWHGAVGVAACWAGCADGIVSRLVQRWNDDPHANAHLGAIDALLWNLRAIIASAGDQIDTEPVGSADTRQRRAMSTRYLADAAVGDIMSRITRALGPGPLAHTKNLHRHLAETDLYRRQSHAERDLEALGVLVRHGA